MNKVDVFIINGKPRSGKTTFEKYFKDMCVCIDCKIVSSIDSIKTVATALGWNGIKNPHNRTLLKQLKDIAIDFSNMPTRVIVDQIMNDIYDDGGMRVAYMVDIREPVEIIKMVTVLGALGIIYPIRVRTVLIRRPDTDNIKYGNRADDDEVFKYDYDYDFCAANLEELSNCAKALFKSMYN